MTGKLAFEKVSEFAQNLYESSEPTETGGTKICMNPEDYLNMKAYYNTEIVNRNPSLVLSARNPSYFGYPIVSDETVEEGTIVSKFAP